MCLFTELFLLSCQFLQLVHRLLHLVFELQLLVQFHEAVQVLFLLLLVGLHLLHHFEGLVFLKFLEQFFDFLHQLLRFIVHGFLHEFLELFLLLLHLLVGLGEFLLVFHVFLKGLFSLLHLLLQFLLPV